MSNASYDCLLVGNNQTPFHDYVSGIEKMGEKSGAFRDISLHFIMENGKYLSFSDYYNKNCAIHQQSMMSYNEILSATIAYLGTYLYKRGLSFSYINCFQDQKEEFANLLKTCNFSAIAITTTYYMTAEPIEEIIEFIRTYNENVKIIVGGPYILNQINILEKESVDYLLNHIDADYYINSSQGEFALSEILLAIKDKKEFMWIKNIIYKQNGTYFHNPIEKEYNSLEENPVDWKLFSNSHKSLFSVRTAISCPFQCEFCGFPQRAGKFTFASPERIVKELDELNKITGVRNVNFLDDTFNVPTKRFKEILQGMSRKKYQFQWNGQIRCQCVNREIAELMKESGCSGVFLGIESGNQQILDNMKKKASIDDYYKGMELLKEYGITTYASFIIGFPGETEQTVKDTIRFIDTSKPDFYRTQLWYYDPITPISQSSERFGIKNSFFEWEHYSMNSKEAADWIDYVFMQVKDSIWLPQNGFDFPGLFILISKGLVLKDIKKLILDFNSKVEKKIKKQNNHLLFSEEMKRYKSISEEAGFNF